MLDRSCCALQQRACITRRHSASRGSLFLGRAIPKSFVLAGKSSRSIASSTSGTGTLQLPGAADADGTQIADIFQSALNALDLVSPSENYRDFGDPHEDISVEQGQAAAQVGKAVYEVGQHCKWSCLSQLNSCFQN